jgi:hypothetical protein
MIMSSVSLSVVIPAFNASGTLAQALDSLCAQTRSDWEAIIVDDGSTDETVAVARCFTERDQRFHLICADHRGASAARNTGIEAAGGGRLLFLDADDWIAPTYVEKMLGALEGAADAAAAYCAYQRVLPDGSLMPVRWAGEIASAPFETFARRSGTAIHCVVIERPLVLELGGFDTSLQTCEDWDLWQRVARTGARFLGVCEPLAFYRTGSASLSGRTRQMVDDAQIVVRRGFAADSRVKQPAPEHAQGAAIEPSGAADLYATYFVVWCAAMEAGAAREGASLLGALSFVCDLRDYVEVLPEIVCDGLAVGARLPPSDLTKAWSAFETPLLALVDRLQAASSQPTLRRRVRYAVERRLLTESDLKAPVALGLMMGIRLDIGRLAAVTPPAGVDLAYLRLCAGSQSLASVEVPVFGTLSAEDVELLAIERLGRAAYLKRAALTRSARLLPRVATAAIHRILTRAAVLPPREIDRHALGEKLPCDRRAHWKRLFENPDP